MGRFDDHEEEYRGTVSVFRPDAPENSIQVAAHLAGHFSPLSGGYRWTGRLSANPDISKAYQDGVRRVTIRNPAGQEGQAVLGPPNPWGGHPVNGEGRPPFALPSLSMDGEDE